MEKKEKNFLVYTTNNLSVYAALTIEIDDSGEEWLDPDQMEFLENASKWARAEYTNQLVFSDFRPYKFPVPNAGMSKSSALEGKWVTTSPLIGLSYA